MATTSAEEDYLKAIFKISESDKKAVSTNLLSKALSTTPASVTDMIKKLSDKGYINYKKYYGVSLSVEGNRLATGLVRRHRLWEVFLASKLRFGWHQIHEIAEQLEHINSDELIARLDAYLDYPRFDPHGDPIPNAEGRFTIRTQNPLSDMPPNRELILLGVKESNDDFLKFLHQLGIKIGTKIKIFQRNDYDGSLLITIDGRIETTIGVDIAQNLFVKFDQ